jgi:hypothetical protein
MFEGRIARTHRPGDALRYPWGEEHRDASELEQIVAQAPGKPVVSPPDEAYGHPSDLLRNDAPYRIVGQIESARVDGEHAVARVFITDPGTIKAVREDGIDELSLGYACRVDDQRYQRNTYVDHLSVVPRARCGASCALRTDEQQVEPPTENTMRTGQVDIVHPRTDEKLSAKERHALEPSSFAVPGTEDLPIEDEGHLRAAMSRFGQEHFPSPDAKRTAYHRILKRAKELGVDASGFEKMHAEHMDACACGGACQRTRMQVPCQCQGDAASLPGKATKMDELQQKLEAAHTEIGSLKAKLDTAEKERDEARLAAHDAKKALETEKVRADAAEAAKQAAEEQARKDADDMFNARVDARVELLAEVHTLGLKGADGQPVELKKMDERAIKVAVVKHLDGEEIGDKESLEFVNGMYRIAMKHAAAAKESRADLREALQEKREDAAQPTAEKHRDSEQASLAAMQNDTSSAWAKPRRAK